MALFFNKKKETTASINPATNEEIAILKRKMTSLELDFEVLIQKFKSVKGLKPVQEEAKSDKNLNSQLLPE